MAESLGEVSLRVSVEDLVSAGLNAVRQNAERTAQQVSAAFDRVKGFTGVTEGSKLTGKTLDGLELKLRSLRAELGSTGFGTERFKELRREISRTEKEINKLNGTARTTSPVVSAIVGSLAGFVTIGAVAGFFKSAINEAVQLETITRKLSNTLGEAGTAKALSFTRGLADELGLSFKTLSNSFGSFTAAATAAGVPLKDQRALFAAVSKSAQQLGLSNDELSGSLLALQQIASKGTVQMEELRGQLGERLPIAFGATARGLGITQRELIKLVETGRLTSDQFFNALTKGLNELASTASGVPTTAQNFQRLANEWNNLQAAFGTNLLPQVNSSLRILTEYLEALGRKNIADRLGFGTGAVGNLAILSDGALIAAENYKLLRKEFDLTDQQATALFFDARKAEGLAPFSSLNAEDTRKVTDRMRLLAEEYRSRFPIKDPIIEQQVTDNTLTSIGKIQERIKALQQERVGLDFGSERFAAIGQELAFLQGVLNSLSAPNLGDAALQLAEAGRVRLDAAQRSVTLEGEALSILQQQLAVEEARRKERDAFNAYNDTFKAANGDASDPAVVQAAARYEEAANNTRAALIEGANGIRQNLEQATNRLQNASVSIFRFLSPQSQATLVNGIQRQIDQIQSVTRGLNNAAIDAAQRDFQRTGDISGLSNLLSGLKEFKASQDGLKNAQAETNKFLQANTEAVAALAGKDWGVSVSVNADGAANVSGDAINRNLS